MTATLTQISSTAYGNVLTNGAAVVQCTIVTDPIARAGYIWRYGSWYDRSPVVQSRLWMFSQRRPVGSPNGWEAPTVLASTGTLNETNSATDGHLPPHLGVDETGRLHVFWNAHWMDFQYAYWRGTAPGDITITAANTMGGLTGNALPAGLPPQISYPKQIRMLDGSLCMTGRLGAPGNGTQGLWEFDSVAGTWALVSDVMIAPPTFSPYMHHVHVNPVTGVVHFAFVVATGGDTTTYRDICYFNARRAGGPGTAWTFKSADGVTRSLPVTDAAAFQAQTTGLNRGLAVQWGLTCTADDRPIIEAVYAKDSATDNTGGSNRYIITRVANAWARYVVHETHPVWNLIDAAGSFFDPNAPNSEYLQVSTGCLLYDAANGNVHCVYRSNYQLGSAGIPCLMVTTSHQSALDLWSAPLILADTPVGDYNPTHDTEAWRYFQQATFLSILEDVAGQWPGGAASPAYIADVTLPENTMGTLATYTRNAMLDHVRNKTTHSPAATHYLHLYSGGGTTTPLAGTGNGYAAVAKTDNTTTWPNAASRVKSNGVAFTFPTPTGTWPDVTGWKLTDDPAEGAGHLLASDTLSAPVPVSVATGPLSFAIGAITITAAAGGFVDSVVHGLLDLVFGGTAYTQLVTTYGSWWVGDPQGAGSQVGSRVAMTQASTWGAASAGLSLSAADVTLTQQVTGTYWAEHDASSASNLIFSCARTSALTGANGTLTAGQLRTSIT